MPEAVKVAALTLRLLRAVVSFGDEQRAPASGRPITIIVMTAAEKRPLADSGAG